MRNTAVGSRLGPVPDAWRKTVKLVLRRSHVLLAKLQRLTPLLLQFQARGRYGPAETLLSPRGKQ
jgi:hypothetical protein